MSLGHLPTDKNKIGCYLLSHYHKIKKPKSLRFQREKLQEITSSLATEVQFLTAKLNNVKSQCKL